MEKKKGLFKKIGLGFVALSLVGTSAGVLLSMNKSASYVETDAAVVTSGYKTIWATSDNANWTSASSITKLHYWGDGVTEATISADYTYAWNSSSNYVYFRFIVPIAVANMQFVRCNSTGTDSWDYTGDITSIEYGTMYYIWEKGSWNFSTSTGTVKDKFPVEAFAKAVEGIQTCSSSTANGYPLYSNLNTNFYAKLVSDADLTSVSISDYSYEQYVNAGKNYNNISWDPATSVTVKDKWDGIKAQFDANKSLKMANNIQSETLTTAVVVISILSVTAIGGFFFYKKKKLQ